MATNFQPSSFIPKESMDVDSKSSKRRRSTRGLNIFMLIALIVLGFSVLLGAGVFGYEEYLSRQLDDKKAQLEEKQSQFEPELIEELNMLDTRISAGQQILSSHTSVTPLFALLENNTLASVQLEEFEFTKTESGGDVRITGKATGYPAVALQSDRIGSNQYIQNPVFSNFQREEESGDVEFLLEFSVERSLLSYENLFSQQ